MSHFNGWSDVPLTPEETWEQRAEAFRRGMSEVDQAGDMLAVERARSKRWKLGAAHFRWKWRSEQAVVEYWRDRCFEVMSERDNADADAARLAVLLHDTTRERDEARAALLKRMGKDDRSAA